MARRPNKTLMTVLSMSYFPWKVTVAILYCSLRTVTLDWRNTRGYTIGGHARDWSRDRRLRIVHSLQLVQITQYLYIIESEERR